MERNIPKLLGCMFPLLKCTFFKKNKKDHLSDPKKDVTPKETGQVRMVKKLAKLAYYVTKQIKLTSWNRRISREADSDQQTFLSNHPGPDQGRVLGYGHKGLKTHLPEYTV